MYVFYYVYYMNTYNRNKPLNGRYSVKTDKILLDLEMETKINNGKQSKFNRTLKALGGGLPPSWLRGDPVANPSPLNLRIWG